MRKKTSIPLLTLIALILLPFLTGCQTLQGLMSNVAKPTAHVKGAHIENLSLDKVDLVFDLEVNNPYSVPLPITSYQYSLSSGETPFLNGKKDGAESIPANGTGAVKLPASISYSSLLSTLKSIKPGAVAPYTADLTLKADAPGVGPVELPMKSSGELPVPAPPEVSMEGIKWEHLGLDGARGAASLGIRNTNSFPIDLDGLSYQLSLLGRKAASGSVDEPVHFDAGGSNTLKIPFDLSTSNMGFAFLSALKGKSADYDLSGGVQLKTPYGPYKTQFNRSGKAALSQ